MDLFDAQIMAKELIGEHLPYYTFGWMNEKTVNGRCYYRQRLIALSRPLTQLRSVEAVRTTIMHEIAHGLTPGARHGAQWKAQMRKFGLPAERCSQDQVDRSSISNWKAVCRIHGVTQYFIRKPRVARSCGKCSPGKWDALYALSYLPN